jgi:hypothetical protein
MEGTPTNLFGEPFVETNTIPVLFGDQAAVANPLPVVLVVAFWTGATAIIQGFKVVNDRRDVILTGFFERKPMTLEHRRVSFWNDWVPLKLGLGFASLIYAFVVVVIVELVTEKAAQARPAAYAVASIGVLSAAGFLILGWRDFRFIRSELYRDRGVCDDGHVILGADAEDEDDSALTETLKDFTRPHAQQQVPTGPGGVQ